MIVAEEDRRVTGFVGYGGAEPPTDAALDALRAKGSTTAVLWALGTNVGARRFYEHGGWMPDGGTKMQEFGGRPLEEVRYRRPCED